MNIRKVSVSSILIGFILIMGLSYKYIEHYEIWNRALLILTVLLLVLKRSRRKMNNVLVFQYTVLAIFLIMFVVVYSLGDNTYTRVNLGRMVPPFILSLVLSLDYSLSQKVKQTLSNKKIMIALNLFYIINLIVIVVQVYMIHGFMMKKRWLELNGFYPDQCCGLFGNSGTHELCFFTAFITIYNICNYINEKNKRLLCYIMVSTAFSLIISTQNDNMSMFLVLTIVLAVYFLSIIQWKTKCFSSRVGKIMNILIICIIIGFLLWIIPVSRTYIIQIYDRMKHLIEAVNMSTTGGYERMAILTYTLRTDWGWRLGKGLGYAQIIESGERIFGFRHFGLNSTGTFITMGGVWFYLLYSIVFASESAYIFSKEKGMAGNVIAVTILFLFFSFYSPIYSSNVSIIWISLMWYGFSKTKDFYQQRRKLSEQVILDR